MDKGCNFAENNSYMKLPQKMDFLPVRWFNAVAINFIVPSSAISMQVKIPGDVI